MELATADGALAVDDLEEDAAARAVPATADGVLSPAAELRKGAAVVPSWLIPHVRGAGDAAPRGLMFDGRATEAALLAQHPVKFRCKNKKVVQRLAYPRGTLWSSDQTLRVTRWDARELTPPLAFPASAAEEEELARGGAAGARAAGANTCGAQTVETVARVFSYIAWREGTSAWWPNFAHRFLFTAWNSVLLAQDELQVLEMPVLSAVARGPKGGKGEMRIETAQPGVGATPVLIQGACRRCAIDTGSAPSVYGNAFRAASKARVRAVTHVLSPPTVCNIYALEAPRSGYGEYTSTQIEASLRTAYAAFAAIRVVDRAPTELHIGYWGCGAYGGNRVLMTAVQLLAARLAGVAHVVVHGVPDAADAERAVALLSAEDAPRASTTFEGAVEWLRAKQFRWGTSDGT